MKKIHYINKKQKIFHINSSDSSYSSSPQTHSASMNFENDIKIIRNYYKLNIIFLDVVCKSHSKKSSGRVFR